MSRVYGPSPSDPEEIVTQEYSFLQNRTIFTFRRGAEITRVLFVNDDETLEFVDGAGRCHLLNGAASGVLRGLHLDSRTFRVLIDNIEESVRSRIMDAPLSPAPDPTIPSLPVLDPTVRPPRRVRP